MIFASRPQQTLFSALCDAADVFGKKRRVEDMKQIEYSYNDLLKMALMLSRLVERHTAGNERVGLLLPTWRRPRHHRATARRRVPAMLNTPPVDAMQAACTAAEVRTIVTSRPSSSRPSWPTSWQATCRHRAAGLPGRPAAQRVGLGDKLWLMAWAIHRAAGASNCPPRRRKPPWC